MRAKELAASRTRGTLPQCAEMVRPEWKSFPASVRVRVITCADVAVNRYLSPDTPIGSDRTEENFQLALYEPHG